MTERQAWAALAKGVETGRYLCGLCEALAWGGDFEALSVRVDDRIRARIRRLPNRNQFGLFKWPLNVAGQKARAAYCRRQVARLTRKKVAKRPSRRRAA